jgi:hypothetical protein
MPRTTSTISAIILSRGNRAAGGIAALHLAEMASPPDRTGTAASALLVSRS